VGQVTIYGVLDPQSRALVYVGQTTLSAEGRLRQHLADRGKAKNADAPFYEWMRAVCDERGERPIVVTLEACEAEVALYRERFWYGYWRLRGVCLLNRVEPSIPGFGWGLGDRYEAARRWGALRRWQPGYYRWVRRTHPEWTVAAAWGERPRPHREGRRGEASGDV